MRGPCAFILLSRGLGCERPILVPAGARHHAVRLVRRDARQQSVRSQRGVGGKVAAAPAPQRSDAPKPRAGAFRRRKSSRSRFWIYRRTAGPDLARNGCRTAQATDQNQPQLALAFSPPTQHHAQKKCCKQPNGSERMWRERAAAGHESKLCLILPGWCLSTRPPSARTW